jgi:transposase
MESTGVYWKPVWHIPEGGFDLILANAAHIRNVSGRKTDMNDAMWMADLLAHGLIRGSFVPPEPVQNLRTLTRTRKQLVQEKNPAYSGHSEDTGGYQYQDDLGSERYTW